MSRSYRKHDFSQIACGEDKPFRQLYNRARRRKDNIICKEIEKGFDIFKPYGKTCSLNGEVCDIDVDAYCLDLDDKHDVEIYNNNLINPEEILSNVSEKMLNKCIGCMWSDNCWSNGNFVDMWEKTPDEKFINSRIDYTIPYADKWGWPSDGGAYWQSDLSELRKKADEEVFGIDRILIPYSKSKDTFWEQYKKYRSSDRRCTSCWFFLDMLFTTNIVPKTFWGPKDLTEWYLAHQEELIKLWSKMRRRK